MTECFISGPHGSSRTTQTGARRFPAAQPSPSHPVDFSQPAEGVMTVARRKAAHAQRGKAELNPHDALVLLTAEHNEIDKLAREFERLRKAASAVDKGKAALRLCHALERYAAIKHEVFYPAADAVLTGEDRE